ncbi:YwiC-like family protein [Streptomyces sp. NPDC090025]|uniref:YwiC-like family protein n=1 Tax=Streptomyces sp. NPDC090025 TaxID=3365922 RepID=UPI003837D00E
MSAAGRWIPNQHGAWAMLVVPFAAGVLIGDPVWAQLPLFVAWLLAYVVTFHAQQWLRLRRLAHRACRTPRPATRAAGPGRPVGPSAPAGASRRGASARPARHLRHVRPVLVLGTALAALGVPLAVLHPWLLLAAAAATPFLAVNLRYAAHNRERALLNGLAAVVPACGMLLVTLRLGGGTLTAGLAPAAACLLYFAGTVPYVKTMIRERNSAAYRRGSIAYHALALPAATLLNPWLALPFTLYLARAAVLPGRGLKVPVVGAVEVGCSLLLLGFLTAGYG